MMKRRMMKGDILKNLLSRIKLGKAHGPDGITSWKLQDLALIFFPTSNVFLELFHQRRLLAISMEKWQHYSLPKRFLPRKIESDMRPVS